jgi:hypothetical protein
VLRHVATMESIESSTRIEGNRLSDRDLECRPANIEIETFVSRDEYEVAGVKRILGAKLSSLSIQPR